MGYDKGFHGGFPYLGPPTLPPFLHNFHFDMDDLGSKAGGFHPVSPPLVPDCFDFGHWDKGGHHPHVPPPPIHVNEFTEHLVPTALNKPLDLSATDGHGHMLVGSGIPSTSLNVQHNDLAGIEGAFDVNYRQGNVIPAYSVDNHGVLNFYVPTGAQVPDPAHGVSSSNPNRAAWNFNYSLDALGSHKLGDYDIHLKIDIDPSIGVNMLDLHLVPAPAGNPTGSHSGFVFENFLTHQIVIGDSGGVTDHVDQNSFNFAFIASQIDTNPSLAGIQPYHFEAGTFDIELTASQSHDHTIASPWGPKSPSIILHTEDTVIDLHAQVHVVPTTDFHLV